MACSGPREFDLCTGCGERRGRRGKDGRFMAEAGYQECFDSRDYQEWLRAFAEGRDPVVNGS